MLTQPLDSVFGAIYLDVLHQLVFADDFPASVMAVIATDILRTFDLVADRSSSSAPDVQMENLKSRAVQVLGDLATSDRIGKSALWAEICLLLIEAYCYRA